MQKNGVAPKSLSESAFLIERFTIQPALNRVVSHDGSVTHLEPKVMQLLVSLAERPDEVLPRDKLLNLVWGDAFVSEQVLTNAISQIRQSFGEAGREYLQTIPKIGYRLTARVLPESAPVSSILAVKQGEGQQRLNVSGNRKSWRGAWVTACLVFGVIAIAGYSIWQIKYPTKEHKSGGPQIAIAVLPFQNLGADKEKDFLRFALSDRIATSLTYAPSLAVRPSAVTQKYSTGGVDPQLAGRELRVSKVITGEFLEEANTLRITVELVDVEQNRVAWRSSVIAPASRNLELDRQVIFLVREQLLSALQVKARREGNLPTNAEAYELFMRSLSLSSDPIPNKEALKMLDRVVALDPNYAPAWIQVAVRSYNDSRYSDGGEAAFGRAEMAYEQAQKLDPNLARPVSVLINYRVERGRLNEAWLRAQELYQQFPDEAYSSFALSYVLHYAGIDEEAARQCDRTIALDKTKSMFRSCFSPYFSLGEYEKALQVIREQAAGTQYAYLFLGEIYLSQGDRASALQNFRKVHNLHGDFMTACLTGASVKNMAKQLESYAADNDPELMWNAAQLLSYCGETDRAIRLMRSGIAHNFCGYPSIERDPMLAIVRSRPEYSELRANGIACQQNFLKFRKSLAAAK